MQPSHHPAEVSESLYLEKLCVQQEFIRDRVSNVPPVADERNLNHIPMWTNPGPQTRGQAKHPEQANIG
jgi:hypothetical protein